VVGRVIGLIGVDYITVYLVPDFSGKVKKPLFGGVWSSITVAKKLECFDSFPF
jgi:hypothetical protein